MFAALLAKHSITAYRCARDIGVTSRHTYDLVDCRRSVTPILALKLARYFGNTSEAWLSWQAAYDLALSEASHKQEIQNIRPLNDRRDPQR
jgi:addiction module HigA family antidote